MKHALGNAAVKLGLGRPKRALRDRLVAAADGDFHLLDEGPDAADPRVVADGGPCVTPNSLLGGFVLRHGRMTCFFR